MFNKLINKMGLGKQDVSPMLSIFEEKKCIFFHIPKTAGISVSTALFGNVKWGHRNVAFYKSHFGEEPFNSMYKFSFVRNPYDRLYSAFTFLKNGGMNNQDLLFSKKYLNSYSDFNDFVMNGLNKKEIINWIHFKPQHYFLCDENENMVMDFVGKMENINEDFKTVCKQLNIEVELKKLNKGSNKKYIYSEETKSIIKSTYKKDFILLYPEL